MFWIGLTIGLLIGGTLGILFGGMCAIGRIQELEKLVDYYREQGVRIIE